MSSKLFSALPERSMNRCYLFALVVTLLQAAPLLAQYPQWKHSGTVFLNTTPAGANLPASAVIEEFPLLVRLHQDYFDFATAKPNGEDIRFSMAGLELAYQIEHWDAELGTASIWVRVPKIVGNSQQELRVHWGNADAVSESNGSAVFNASNGFLSVFHLAEEVTDTVGTVQAKNVGTTPTAGIIGTARRFAGSQGVIAGEQISNFPVGANPHTTETWLRVAKPNGRAVAWGNEHGQGKVVMLFESPPHISMDCYFSGANIQTQGRLPMNEWVHIMHTYEKGDSRIYVNGELNNVSKTNDAPLAIKTPCRLYIGGWYNHYDFEGDIDEVRISNVARSPAWVKLQFENQKQLQTLVGPIVQAGDSFEISTTSATIAEGTLAVFSIKAIGARKLYWIVNNDSTNIERLVAVDRMSFTFDAGRVTGDQDCTLQCRAIYPEGVRTKEIKLTVKEAIPDPLFTLTAPKVWDGRTPIEVITSFLTEVKGDLQVQWSVTPFAVIQQSSAEKLLLQRAQNSGRLSVTATLSNGGAQVQKTVEIAVTEPKSDPWTSRVPDPHEQPQEGQFYARDDQGEGTLHYNGKLNASADSVFLRLYADDKPVDVVRAKVNADQSYSLSVKLKPGLIKYKVEFGTGDNNVLNTVGNIVCGDAFIIDGQSNALATDTAEQAPSETNQWIRSYANPSLNPQENTGNLWVLPVWKARQGEKAELGWWGMELAKSLVEKHQVPVFIINAAVGGTRIDQHQRNSANPTDLGTIYGRMLWRVQQAKLTHGIRSILWHQGENDQGAAGPTGGYGWESYHSYFIEMAAGWKSDFPNVQNYYVFQIWPNSCSMGGSQGSGDMLREQQRTLPFLFSNMSILSTLGVRPPGGCHYPLEGWAQFSKMVQPLIERDHYGIAAPGPLTSPNLLTANYGQQRDTLLLEFDQPINWDDKLANQFYLDDEKGRIAGGSVTGSILSLKLKESSTATKITYLKETQWNQDNLLMGTNGLAALTFANVPLTSQSP
jgi:Concanavalin A-like lectin/glucanases superfamily/Domain of unknown function (DUF2341)/Carbohydrate esterase, sialic acid-specific acetylesterase